MVKDIEDLTGVVISYERVFREFHKFHMSVNECKILFIIGPFRMGFRRNCIVDMVILNKVPPKIFLHMWSYNFYDKTLSTVQGLHMIEVHIKQIKMT